MFLKQVWHWPLGGGSSFPAFVGCKSDTAEGNLCLCQVDGYMQSSKGGRRGSKIDLKKEEEGRGGGWVVGGYESGSAERPAQEQHMQKVKNSYFII